MGNLQEKVSGLHLQERVSGLQDKTKGLFSEFGNKAPRVLLLGLDGAGKTTLLYKAKLNSTMFTNVPPIGVNIEEMTPRRGATIAIWDMRGDKLHRHLWGNYFSQAEAIVFVVDSSDQVRLDEAQYELSQLLQSRYLSKAPIVVAANKQDAEGALGPDEVSGLLELGVIQDRHWSIFGTNSQKGKGIKDVFKEVVRLIKLTRKEKVQRKSELLNKYNDKLKGNKEVKNTEIEVKVPPLDLNTSDDSIKKYSLFENISKSNSSSEDGNENKSGKSDQYDTVFEDNSDVKKPDEMTNNCNNRNDYENVDQSVANAEVGDKLYSKESGDGGTSSSEIEETCVAESNIAEAKQIGYTDRNDTVGDGSVTDVKVTDLDSDSDDSTQDNVVGTHNSSR